MGVACESKERSACFPSYETKTENLEIKNYKHVIWKYDIRHHKKQMGELKTIALGCGAGCREEWNREAFSCLETCGTV